MPSFHSSQFKTTDIIIRTFIMSILNLQGRSQISSRPPSQTIRLRSITFRNSRIFPFPRLLFQRFQKAGVISLMAYESFSEKLLAKGSCQDLNITGTFTKRRKMHLKHRKTIKQVFTEMSCPDLLLQVAVGSSNDTHIDSCRLGITDLYIFACFKNTQQFARNSKAISPISSKKIVPLLASSKSPFLSFKAPVKDRLYARTFHSPTVPY